MNNRVGKVQKGFTIVELLIVVVVIAIIAAITIVSYNGIQVRAKKSALQSTLSQLHKKIEIYKVENGEYPKTQTAALLHGINPTALTYADTNCTLPAHAQVTYTSNWIPGISGLPQSNNETGVADKKGCYIYQSDGVNYVLSAWNMVSDGSAESSSMYRRLGFREMINAPFYHCNFIGPIGGVHAQSGVYYTASADIYKHSYTISSIKNCNETPPYS